MRRAALAALVVLAACKTHKAGAPGPEPIEIIPIVKAWGDRACACNADKDCVKPIRDEWEANKRELLAKAAQLTGDNKAQWDAALLAFRGCGDGAGVTIWVEH